MSRRRLGYVVLWDDVPADYDMGTNRLYRGAAVSATHDMREVSFGGALFADIQRARRAIENTYTAFAPDDPGRFKVAIIYPPESRA